MAALTALTNDLAAQRDGLLAMLAPLPPAGTIEQLDAVELEALILAADERLETAPADQRDPLRRGRLALERELARVLEASDRA